MQTMRITTKNSQIDLERLNIMGWLLFLVLNYLSNVINQWNSFLLTSREKAHEINKENIGLLL